MAVYGEPPFEVCAKSDVMYVQPRASVYLLIAIVIPSHCNEPV